MFRNVKMPAMVGILTFVSMMKTNFECFEVRQIFYVLFFFNFLQQLTSVHEHSFITSESDRAETHATVNHKSGSLSARQ